MYSLVAFLLCLLVGCSQNYSEKSVSEALVEKKYQPVKDRAELEDVAPAGKYQPVKDRAELEDVAPAGSDQESGTGASGTRQRLKGISVVTPQGWRRTTPTSSMRIAEYLLPGGTEGHADASLAVFYFGPNQGGTIEANIDRWYGQFSQPDGGSTRDRARRWEKQVGTILVTLVDISGTYSGGMGPMGQSQAPKTGQRMLGAIAPAPTGLFFFKLIGPTSTIELWSESFVHFIDSIRAE